MSRRILVAVLMILGFLGSGASPLATAQVPTLEQLEILRNLTPEQRDALLQQLGLDPSLLGSGGQISRSPAAGLSSEFLEREIRLRASRQEQEELDERRVFQPGDTVLLQIDIRRAAVPVQPSPSPPAQATGAEPAQTLPQQPYTEPEDIEFEPGEREQLQELITLVRARNPYKLDRNGLLFLPGLDSRGIALAGLTEYLATMRLQAEPAFQKLSVVAIRLPLEKTGPEGLEPFGYRLFEEAPSTFAPITEVPVPASYLLGPGDELTVQLYGSQNRRFTLVVGRDGRIDFPELGPISVGGQRFDEVRSDIESRVTRQMIGVQASVSMGATRSIRVFVLGDARFPGTYTVSGLSTITSAIYAAGGIKTIGSLRNIELKRQGRVVQKLDLYNLLLRGDSSDDARLLPGDVIFVPPVGATVGIDGEVRRPAIYEIASGAMVADLLELAGGLTAEADTSKLTLTRITDDRLRVVNAISLGDAARSQGVRDGDLLRVDRLRPTLDSAVVLQGHVYTPGAFAYEEGMRLTDVLASVGELRLNADLQYILIRRELPPDRRVVAISADLTRALQSPGSESDPLLAPRDQITVFDIESGRQRTIEPLLEELRLQARIGRPTEVVRIDGEVRAPGEYPLEPGMTIGDLIRAGGSPSDAAYGGQAELARYAVVNGESRRTRLISIDLAAVLRGDPGADIALEPFDSLSIKKVPEWNRQEEVTLQGEVRFPGRYAIKPGETLKSVLARAGGLTEYAFPEGSIFTRQELKEREQEQIDRLAERLQSDLVTLALQGATANQAQAATALSVGQSLLAQMRETDAVGRLVIDLPRTMASGVGSPADIVLRDGDQLIVPRFRQEVMVLGEVQNATSHLYRPGIGRDDYIELSGGTTRRADRNRVYVVRADGSVVAGNGSRWFRRGADVRIRPGDAVVVPLDTERLPPLPLWQAVTQIVYNLAIAAAAVNSF